MRFIIVACILTAAAAAAEPSSPLQAIRPLLDEALKTFRTEGPKGWSFTQTTRGEDHSRVERYDAAQPEFDRWTLLQQDDRAPTPEEAQDYREKLSRRSRGGTAPRLTDQLDLTTLALVSEQGDRATLSARLKPGESGDRTAKYLVARIGLHKPSRTIETFELAAEAPFSPTLGVKISAMKTTLTYSLPDGDRPSLLQSSTTHLRGRAFFFKSLDADMTVTFTDYERATRKKK
jgi:hypothetical protein